MTTTPKAAAHLTDEEVWAWAGTIHDEGRSDGHRGRFSLDPTLHLIPRGTDELWCSGGPAERCNTARRRHCRRCLNLAREMWEDLAGVRHPTHAEMKAESGCQNPDPKWWCGRHTCKSACPALIAHGPGHQSTSHCELTGQHDEHEAAPMRVVLRWSGMTAYTDYFDESPL